MGPWRQNATFDWCAWGPYTTCWLMSNVAETQRKNERDYFLSLGRFILNVKSAQEGRKDSHWARWGLEHSSAMFSGLGFSLDPAIPSLRSVTVAKGNQPPHARPSSKQPSSRKGVIGRHRQAKPTWDSWSVDETREKAGSHVGGWLGITRWCCRPWNGNWQCWDEGTSFLNLEPEHPHKVIVD